MAPLSTTASLVRRLGDPDRPIAAVALMVGVSLVLLAAVLVALPSAAEGSHATVVDVAPPTGSSGLLDGPGGVVIPQPDGDRHGTRVIVNHRAPDVEVTAHLANGDGLEVALAGVGRRATEVVVTSDAIHVCGRYAGTLVLEASQPAFGADVLVLDVRYAECDQPRGLAMAPDSVHDVEPTWADDGRAPWLPVPPAALPPPSPTETGTATEQATPDETPTQRPTTDPRPDPGPTAAPDPEPEPSPTATRTPRPTPTEPSPTSSPTAEPSPTSSPTSSPTGEPEPSPTSTTTTGPSGGSASPDPSPTSTTPADGG